MLSSSLAPRQGKASDFNHTAAPDGRPHPVLQRLRTLHVIDSLNPTIGGPPQGVRQLAKAYTSLGRPIEIACLDDPRASFLQGVSCPIHALGQSYFGAYAFSSRLSAWLNVNLPRFDAVVMHGIWSFPGIAVRSAARRTNKPYGIFVHGALNPWFDNQYPLKRLKKSVYWPLQHMVLRDASAVFFTAEAERDLAKTSYKPSTWNSVVLSYGINDPEQQGMNPEEQTKEFYASLPQLRGRRHLLFLGRIHQVKGCDLLIQAFARIAGELPDVDLVIAGPDSEGMQARLQGLAQNSRIERRIHWPGMINGSVKWGALRACDALVLPSHSENFGISVVEALAVGRPVLISNKVNIWRAIVQDGVGLVADDTLEGTEHLLRQWFSITHDVRDAMSAKARPSFLERFTITRTATTIHNVFADVIRERESLADRSQAYE